MLVDGFPEVARIGMQLGEPPKRAVEEGARGAHAENESERGDRKQDRRDREKRVARRRACDSECGARTAEDRADRGEIEKAGEEKDAGSAHQGRAIIALHHKRKAELAEPERQRKIQEIEAEGDPYEPRVRERERAVRHHAEAPGP